MPSARDNCFSKSVEKLQDSGKLKKLKVQNQQRWVRNGAGQWSQTNEVWYKVVRAVSRAKKWFKETGLPVPDDDIAGTRIPDMTVTPEGGKPVVIDNKFDGDQWQIGQKEDYDKINEQQNGNPAAKNLQLNSEVCKCGEEGATDPVPVDAPGPVEIPGMDPVPINPFKGFEFPVGDPVLVPG